MGYVVPAMCWTGICLAVNTGLLVPMIESSVTGESEGARLEKSMFALVSLGVGEIVGALLIGQVIDRMGNRPAIICTVASVAIQATFLVIFHWQNSYGVLTHVMTFFWGFSDGIVNTHVQDILGFEFAPDNVRPYSIFNFLQSMVIFVFLIIEAAVITR